MARESPNSLFVFGDNMVRRGLGGQAAALRGEPNAVGIPTKWFPTMEEKAYFVDEDLWRVKPFIDVAFDELAEHLSAGGEVVWPKDGVGSGLAELESRAPAIWDYINQRFASLQEMQ
jgi:hypothetical protein